jgi:hypothetical protein
VAWRSAFGFDERTQTITLPAPITAVFCASGPDTYDSALPSGG